MEQEVLIFIIGAIVGTIIGTILTFTIVLAHGVI